MADQPKIHIDSDWKAEAQKEKQRLAEQEQQKASAAGPAGAPGDMPESPFEFLVSTMATQALFAMGAIPDPATGQRIAHLDLAKHHIDMLGVIEDKTKGNLTPQEAELLQGTLYELRQQFIALATHAAKQRGMNPAAAGSAAAATGSKPAGPIIQ